jgi:hypothetical protein
MNDKRNMIRIELNLKKLDKERFVQGKHGTYIDLMLIPTPNNRFGSTHMIVHNLKKEERKPSEYLPPVGSATEFTGDVPLAA